MEILRNNDNFFENLIPNVDNVKLMYAMRIFITILTIIVICNILILFVYNIYPNNANIIYGIFYDIKNLQYNEILTLEIDAQNYLEQKQYKINKFITEDHDTQMFLKDIITDKDKIHLTLNSETKRNLKEGKFLTLRNINNRHVCGFRPITIEATDSEGNMIPFVQYSISPDEALTINIDKEEIKDLDKLYIDIKGYSLLEYKNRLLHIEPTSFLKNF